MDTRACRHVQPGARLLDTRVDRKSSVDSVGGDVTTSTSSATASVYGGKIIVTVATNSSPIRTPQRARCLSTWSLQKYLCTKQRARKSYDLCRVVLWCVVQLLCQSPKFFLAGWRDGLLYCISPAHNNAATRLDRTKSTGTTHPISGILG